MIHNGGSGGSKKRIGFAAILVAAVLGLLTLLFIRDVKAQLWEQSITTVRESTRQGCNTLKIQLQDDYEDMDMVARQLGAMSLEDRNTLESVMASYGRLEPGASLYLEDGSVLPAGTERDEPAAEELASGRERGIVDPHISTATGVNVFDLYQKTVLQDGTEGYLVKEYEVGDIVDSFSLSFYNDAGFSYVVNARGDVLIRPPHPNSNKTVQNLFDMLPEDQNDPGSLEQFAQALETSRAGWALFTYQGERTVFCYTPLGMGSDWHLISIIPAAVVNAQTNQIITRAMLLIGCILLGIALLVLCYVWYANKTNRRLRNQANYIEHLYNAVPEGIALISVEPPYSLIQINENGLRLMGYPEGTANDALKGVTLENILIPEDRAAAARRFREMLRSEGKSAFEYQALRPDGSAFWTSGIIERTLDANGVPVLVTAFHDVTAEKLAAEAAEREKLQERLTLVGAVSNAYPVIISVNLTTDTLSFVYVKEGLLLNLGGQETYSRLYADMLPTVHPDHAEEFRLRFAPENLNRVLGHERNEVFLESRQLLRDGVYHWTSTQIIYVDNPYSDDKLAILISRQVDEQRHEEEQRREALQSALSSARAASEAKGQFLSNMSHDIRTPMNAIVGMTAIAAAHLDDRERVAECLKKISLSSKHLLSLINDVLDMSKIESGKMSLGEEPFNLAELAADTLELVRPQAEEKSLRTKVHLAALKNENVVGDPLRIRQVLINILSNAVKYTPEGGSVLVELRQAGSAHKGYGSYVFRCADTGYGMSKAFMDRLFQPFERARDSTSSKVMGTGLGMAITKNLVDLMNGDIQVESRPGEGSVFTVTLPLQMQDAAKEEVPGEWDGVHSLIVDDDRQTCENAAELLTEMGLRAQFVTAGADAVRCVAEAKNTPDPFQLAIIDWKMPDMDGVEVARRIRREVGPDLPLIVLTAYDWSEIEGEARAAGVTAFLSKPFYRAKICYLLSELSGDKAPAARSIGRAAPDYAGRRLLLVEDNELNREITRELLGETGLSIEEAWDGEEAVQKVSRAPEGYYDLILMDIQMPKMDGYEATKAIRAMERRDAGSIPIIAMTANAFEEDVRAALRAGMNAHFTKPVDPDILAQMMRQYLEPGPGQ